MKKTMIICSLLISFASNAQYSSADSPSLAYGNSFGGAQGTDTTSSNAVIALTKAQERADEHYKAKRYERAYNMYKTLAEYGDKFSQYRVAFMHHSGRGVPKDMTEAFAWSYVAAEAGDEGFVKYHRQVREQFSDSEIKSAKQLAGNYLQDYGMYAQASRAKSYISKEMRKCSGSRVGSSCNKISASGWQCGASTAGELPNADCLTLGMVGIPALAGLQPADMRQAQKNLSILQDKYNPGRVELGELEMIEDEND